MNRVTRRALSALSRFNASHPWSHNTAYSTWVLRQARIVRRRGGERALDVGCGTGALAKRLAGILPGVVGVEPDSPTARRARAMVAESRNVAVLEAPFDPAVFDEQSFDLVTFVAVLHHLPLGQTLEAARDLLRPGGRLVIVGLARESPGERPWSAASMLLNPVIGAIRHPRRAHTAPENMTAPTREPSETFEQIASVASEILPGVRMRRGLFWRYTAVWVKSG
ncbi:class I SAM-dependent methyltransferase [Microbacterium sp. NPDC077644]|uniref:class I SAM-dependent methyltransferase n=1 Tax=Microbacterium sp. NPDC077644 TaxID=3155055 RepID=UPI00344CBEFA